MPDLITKNLWLKIKLTENLKLLIDKNLFQNGKSQYI